MKIKHFHGNLADNIHCFQACYWMAINTLTGQTPTMADVEQATGFVCNLPTWPFAGILAMTQQGCESLYIEDTDYQMFVTNPECALKELVGDDAIVDSIMKTSNMPLEIARVEEILKNTAVKLEKRAPTLADLETMLRQGWLCICNVNSKKLRNVEGYSGHFVVVEDVSSNTITLQNPGLPAVSDQIVSKENFLAAWHYPNERMANIIAFRKR